MVTQGLEDIWLLLCDIEWEFKFGICRPGSGEKTLVEGLVNECEQGLM